MYSQTDPQWRDKKLGNSELCMHYWGCYVTAIAQALTLAGYEINPGQVCDALNANGGFTPQGLVIWAKVEEAYPQFHFCGEGYKFVKGVYKKFVHGVLEHDHKTYDPLFGVDHVPEGFAPTGNVRTASIDPAPQITPHPAPEPQPEPTQPALAPQTPPEQKIYVVKEGDSLSKIAKSELGDGNRWPEIFDLNKDQIKNPNLIFPDQRLIMP
jgi:hypothetical protein